jgi:hypothetical protein
VFHIELFTFKERFLSKIERYLHIIVDLLLNLQEVLVQNRELYYHFCRLIVFHFTKLIVIQLFLSFLSSHFSEILVKSVSL